MKKRILAGALCAAMTNYSQADPLPYTAHEARAANINKTVQVLDLSDSSARNRTRYTAFIYAKTNTYNERILIVTETARLIAKSGADYAQVFLLPLPSPALIGKGIYTATAEYASDCTGPDGQTKLKHCQWQASAITGPQDTQKDQYAALWYTHRDKFTDEFGMVSDEEKLKKHIANQLNNGTKHTEISLPFYIARLKAR